ncbi:MAG: pilus assembly protein [Actinomycetota bacterium]|nr:pilus assembly protein [Actinomycetota bacterium]
MVEFAIVLPVLLLIIVGILSFGRYMNYASQQTQTAASAVRWAAVDVPPFWTPSSLTLQQYVATLVTAESPATVYLYYPTGSSNTVGSSVRACVVSTISLLPVLGTGRTSIQIVESATMRIEQLQTSATWSPATPPTGSPCPLA